MLTYFIIDDLPEEFGPENIISGHRNKKDAKYFLDILKGHGANDSYSHQYYKIFSRNKLKATYPHLIKEEV